MSRPHSMVALCLFFAQAQESNGKRIFTLPLSRFQGVASSSFPRRFRLDAERLGGYYSGWGNATWLQWVEPHFVMRNSLCVTRWFRV